LDRPCVELMAIARGRTHATVREESHHFRELRAIGVNGTASGLPKEVLGNAWLFPALGPFCWWMMGRLLGRGYARAPLNVPESLTKHSCVPPLLAPSELRKFGAI